MRLALPASGQLADSHSISQIYHAAIHKWITECVHFCGVGLAWGSSL
jgi:hypothetical protein